MTDEQAKRIRESIKSGLNGGTPSTPSPAPGPPPVRRWWGGTPRPPSLRRGWMLLLASLMAAAVAVAYYIKRQSGLADLELIRFTSLYLAAPLAISVLLLFAYFRRNGA